MKEQSKADHIADHVAMMTLAECASYLHLTEKTVIKLARDNQLPARMVERKWQFQRDLVDQWLAQSHPAGDGGQDLGEIPDGMCVPLEELMPEEGIIGDLGAREHRVIIEELAARAYSNKWLIDRSWFVGAVLERELLASTAMEGGVAFLHTRAREAQQLVRPFIIFGRSYNGVDFGAPDGKPTFLFFLLGLKYDKLHLPILGRLARTLRNPALVAKLRALPSTTKIRSLLLAEDVRAMSANPETQPTEYEEIRPKLDRQMRLRAIMRRNAMRKHQQAKEESESKKKAARKQGAVRGKKKSARDEESTGVGREIESRSDA